MLKWILVPLLCFAVFATVMSTGRPHLFGVIFVFAVICWAVRDTWRSEESSLKRRWREFFGTRIVINIKKPRAKDQAATAKETFAKQ